MPGHRSKPQAAATAAGDATLELAGSTATNVTFTATLNTDTVNPYSLWVALNGYDSDSVHRSAGFSGIRWDETAAPAVGTTCQVTVPKNADPSHPVARYDAVVVVYPDVWAPVSDPVEVAP